MKQITAKQQLSTAISATIQEVADITASTLGPKGSTVILKSKDSRPIATKDGVTVTEFISFEDPAKNAVAEIVKQAARQVNVIAGDGTTTAILLANAIYQEAQRYVVAGCSLPQIKRDIQDAVAYAVERIAALSKPISSVDDIRHIATISANNDAYIGDLIADAVAKVGKNGALTIEESRNYDTFVEVSEGFVFPAGFVSQAFVNDENRKLTTLQNPYILVTDETVNSLDQLMFILKFVANEKKPLLIVADNIEGEALAALILNTVKGNLKICAVKAPFYGEERENFLRDLAISCGATFISRESPELSLATMKPIHLGKAKTAEIQKHMTTIVEGNSDAEALEKQIEELKEEVVRTEDLIECERIQNRVTRLGSAVATIYCGGATEIEMLEKKHRVEDALRAIASAKDDGVVIGGGMTYLQIANCMPTDKDGWRVVQKALRHPFNKLAENGGLNAGVIEKEIRENEADSEAETCGFNFLTESHSFDMLKDGIVDPAKVAVSALQNAASVAISLLSSNYAIIET